VDSASWQLAEVCKMVKFIQVWFLWLAAQIAEDLVHYLLTVGTDSVGYASGAMVEKDYHVAGAGGLLIHRCLGDRRGYSSY